MMGSAIIVRTTIATRTPLCSGDPEKRGNQPKVPCRNGSMSERMNGPRTRMPQSPTTTLGTAASISTSEAIGGRIAGGASSVRKSPIATASGAASSIAPKDVTSVPMMKFRAPYASWPMTGFQTPCQMNERPKWRTAGHAPSMTFQMMAAMTTSARTAAAPVRYLRAPSPSRSAR
jgi:hypothetical protein